MVQSFPSFYDIFFKFVILGAEICFFIGNTKKSKFESKRDDEAMTMFV